MVESLRSELRGRVPSHALVGGSGGGGEDDNNDDEGVMASPLLHTSFDGISSAGSTSLGGNDHHHYDDDKRGKASLRRGDNRGYKHIGRDLKLRWRLLNVYSRIVCVVLLFLVTQHIVLGTLDLLFRRVQDWPRQSSETHFAVVINTYKRPDMLREAVYHYAETCGRPTGVGQVFVIWAELNKTPPTPQDLLSSAHGHARRRRKHDEQQHQASVEIIRVAKDSLNSRFLPIAQATSSAIFMVDDDVRVDCASLRQGFDAWRTNPNGMVGYYPRLALESTRHGYVYQAWPGVVWRQAANFILTKACFLHHKYMELYSDSARHPVEILEYVDKYKNCEDVAMSMLVANQTQFTKSSSTHQPPNVIYVEGHVTDKGIFGGISGSGKGQHFNHRSNCLRDMTNMYEAHGWIAPLRTVQSLRDITWVRHAPGVSWQIRPSSFFEWFAFTNMFKS